jgi:hypothetical protein
MSLHGEFARAWKMAPAGPVAAGGLAVFALAMLALAFVQATGAENRIEVARVWLRRSAVAYALAATIVWLGGWVVGLHAALAAR